MAITLKNVTKQFGSVEVLESLDLDVEPGEFIVIVGPSGCGKSTLLNIISGSAGVSSGTIEYDDPDSEISYVYQSPRLLDWRTVEKNLELVLEHTDIPESEFDPLIDEYLQKVSLGDIRDSYPRELSGGMQSRVGLIRGLIVPSNLVLMDEPLGDIDELTARTIRDELLRMWKESSRDKTIMYVTHNVFEAVYMADRVLVMGNKPTSFIGEIDIDLDRPRDPEDSRLFDLQNEVYDALPL